MRYLRTILGVGLLLAATLPAGAELATYTLSAADNARFLADYAKIPGVTVLPDGVMYRIMLPGDGTGQGPLGRQDYVEAEYRGQLIDLRMFDGTKPGEPRTFQVGGVIPGWTEALLKMKTGQEWQIVVPAKLAYGADGIDNVIPPNQTLVFLIKLDKVEYAN